MQVLALIKRDEWSNIVRSKRSIAPLYNIFQIIFRDFILRDIEREYLERELLKRIILPSRLPIGRERWDRFWDEKAAVGGKPFEDDFFESELIYLNLSVSSKS